MSVFFAVYGIQRINVCLSAGYDLGIFDQAIRRYAHFHAPIVTLKGDDYDIRGDHFHPIIVLWVPLYWIWSNIRMLCVGQALVVAATVFPLWRFARRHVTNPRWAKLFVVAVMLFWPVQSLIDYEVHEIAFAIPLLAFIIDALDRRDDVTLLICSALLLCVREDMGVVVLMIGLVRLIWVHVRRVPPGSRLPRRHARDWVVPILLMVAGIGVFYLVTSVIIPHFAVQGFQYWNYPDLGDGPEGAMTGALTHPWKVLALLFYPWTKTLTRACLLLPLALLPLRSPYALLAAPIMASRMLAGRWTLWTVNFHYNAPVWIVAAMASIDAVERLKASHATWIGAKLGGLFRRRSRAADSSHHGTPPPTLRVTVPHRVTDRLSRLQRPHRTGPTAPRLS